MSYQLSHKQDIDVRFQHAYKHTFITLQVFDDVVSVRWSTKFKVYFKLLKNVLTISTRKEGSRHRIYKR